MYLTRTQKLIVKILIIILIGVILVGVYLFAYHLVKDYDIRSSDLVKETEINEETEDSLAEDLTSDIFEETHILYEEGRDEDLTYDETQVIDYIEKYAEIKIGEIPNKKEQKDGIDYYSLATNDSLGLSSTFDIKKDFLITESLDVISLFNVNYIIYCYNKKNNSKSEYIVFYYPSSSVTGELGFTLDMQYNSLFSKSCNFRIENLGDVSILWVKGLES